MPGHNCLPRYSKLLVNHGARPPVNAIAGTYDHVLPETANECWQTEFMCGPETPLLPVAVETLKLAARLRVNWFNEDRPDIHCDDDLSAEFGAAF